MKEQRLKHYILPQQIGQQLIAHKKGRNKLCSCGSGLKAKKCHGDETDYKCHTPNPVGKK